tara:strand:+ start:361 stop:684 length:324 start_codon:yes stop_codon:yes gene_type:complete
MEKFISLPVTGQPNQLVSANGIKLIVQATDATVTITYGSGSTAADVITITHTALAAANEDMQALIQDSVVAALQTAWTKPSFTVIIPRTIVDAAGTGPVTITGIAIA